MRKLRYPGVALLAIILCTPVKTSPSSPLRFEVNIAPGLVSTTQNGRLFVVMSLKGQSEPRLTIGQTGLDASPLLGRDVNGFAPGVAAIIDDTCAAFPIERLSRLEAGEYTVQALFDSNNDLKSVNAPGNLYSKPQRIHLDPKQGATVNIELTERVPAEQIPQEN